MDFYAIEKGIEGDSEIKKLLKESGLNASQLLDLIKTAEDITPYVEDLSIIRNITGYIEDNEKFGEAYNSYDEFLKFSIDLVKSTGEAKKYVKNKELLKGRYGEVYILAANMAEEYLNKPAKLNNLGLKGYQIAALIRGIGKADEYLEKPEMLKKLGVFGSGFADLVIAAGKAEEYLEKPEILNEFIVRRFTINELIIATGKVEEYLKKPEKLKKLGVLGSEFVDLVIAAGKAEEYLEKQKILEEFEVSCLEVIDLIKATGKIDEYIEMPEMQEKLAKLGAKNYILDLIGASKDPSKYLTLKKLSELGIIYDRHFRKDLLKLVEDLNINDDKVLTAEEINIIYRFNINTIKTISSLEESQHKDAIKMLEKLWRTLRVRNLDCTKLFDIFGADTLLKMTRKTLENVGDMAYNHKEDLLEKWYKATGEKFIPHHVVMLNIPEDEIDNFLSNSKRWAQLMAIDNHALNTDGKRALLKAAYAFGVFKGDDEGFNKVMRLFTDIPKGLSSEEYASVINYLDTKSNENRELFNNAYTLAENGTYVLNLDRQKDKESVKEVRKILEKAQVPRILSPEKAHRIFDSFEMKYDQEFLKFFIENLEEILVNPQVTRNIATIQRQFADITRVNAGRKITLDVAQDYIKSISYTDVDVGNEWLAELVKIAGYSQRDFEKIQTLYNEGKNREFSSIPRIQGEVNGYTYEMLRCDDPQALTIGRLTDCCQEIHGAGQTSMEHSVISPDGRVFCVRDSDGRIVAQSWFWRNQYVGCFDNIEIPDRIFDLYEKEHSNKKRKNLASEILEVYKKATEDLMNEDEKTYKNLLQNGTITNEQYNALLLGKVTIGLGYNDIADVIKSDKTMHEESTPIMVKGTKRLPAPYTDAKKQYIVKEREKVIKSEYENLYVYEDDILVYDNTNISSAALLTLQRMAQSAGREKLTNMHKENGNITESQKIINSIAKAYEFEPKDTKVIVTPSIAIIYSQSEQNELKIGEILVAPQRDDLDEEQKKEATEHVAYQTEKAFEKIGIGELVSDDVCYDGEYMGAIIEKLNKKRNYLNNIGR